MARLQQLLPRKDRPGPDREVRLQVADAGPAHHQDHAQHGRGRGGRRQEGHGPRRRRPDQDRRPEAGRHQVEEGRSPASRSATACRSAARSRCAACSMYEFLDRFVTIALPRVRDFRGISGRAFDGRGNYNIGVKEQIIFPEIEYDKIDAIRGMNITHHHDGEERRRVPRRCSRRSSSRSRTEATAHGKDIPDPARTQARQRWSPSTPRSAPS